MRKIWYIWLLRLHPAPFRRRFGREMLAIFEDVAAGQSVWALYIDAIASLFRQWVLRPEFRSGGDDIAAPALITDVPAFAMIDSYKLRPAALLNGSLLSIALLCTVAMVIDRPGKLPSWLIGTHRAAGGLFSLSRSSLTEADPDTNVRISPEPDDRWRALARHYFEAMPVLRALDADHDLVISASEISAAPAVLRGLDKNKDGKLSPEECGFFWSGGVTRDATLVSRARMNFMRFNPILAVLDSDDNGEISAEEIGNSSRSLRRLDINGDGSLSPPEVIANQAARLAASIFAQLDLDHDGRISAAEWGREDSAALREILMSADRNHDGFATMAELTTELLIREQGNGQSGGAK